MSTTVLIVLGGQFEADSATTCGSSAMPDEAVLAGAVVPPAAAAPDAAATAPAVAGRRAMPMAEGTYTISDVFGSRGGGHKGIDMAATDGTPIYAATDGTVVAAGPASGFGNWIVIDTVDEQGRPLSTVYGHMWDEGVNVAVNQKVVAGQPIGKVGSNGESSGAHLHFEVVPGGRFGGGTQIDPQPWLAGAATPDTSTAPGPSSRSGSGGSGADRGDACPPGFGTPGGELNQNDIPDDLVEWYRKAGSVCAEIPGSVLAAQGKQETGFRRGLTSPMGAQGLGQFLPGTAASTSPLDGQPYVIDSDNSGTASVWDDGDAIIGQARYMCAIAAKVTEWKNQGLVTGDVVELTLAGYNAGEGAVLASGGMPNQYPAHFTETQPYVANIMAMEPAYRAAGSTGRFIPTPGANASAIVEAAHDYLGTPYMWGGGGPSGPSGGGFDCSGLTSYAVYQASNGSITLPRTSEQQWEMGTEVPIDQVQAGDLVFGMWSDQGLPGHVGIAMGDGRMIHAPTTGETVKEAPLQEGMRAKRVM
ncbi:peptidoglycan DD-metalloendopeptidase family protein [Nocardia sp. NPDC058518]|uniref:peptidoglycan DD-metalloendopeptidase family protein n=1 Tax=Nocardia sp. NPDC058518 TaxID=3346534 RepID=UPI0036495CAD